MADPQESVLDGSTQAASRPPASNNHHPNPQDTHPSTIATTNPDIPALLASWKLTPSQHEHILHTQILPRELYPFLPSRSPSQPQTQRRRRPLAILILGQTGAGKTRLAPLLLNTLQRHQQQQDNPTQPAVVHLIADTYKTYHPHYHTCLAALPGPHASRLAGADAAAWLRGVCAHAARAGADVLVESACRRSGEFERLVGVFANQAGSGSGNGNGNGNGNGEGDGDGGGGGYDVRVAVLAVPEGLSRLGVLARYHRRLPEAGSRGLPVRLTPRAVHDESYRGLAEAVGWVDRGEEVGRVVVVRRNGLVVYANERGEGGQWRDKAGALEALELERARGLSVEEKKAAEEDLDMLRAIGDPKIDREVEEIEKLMAGLGTGFDRVFPDLKPLDVQDFVSTRVEDGS
ncbi:Zeta toxin domain-containing protein [Madurella fahalii]|uniref:Zeta toxin domain-containing protein n=1 Tax=Madurella fahalii TaxID=1157608 RepID=A0ABQ0GSU1_9PEZI